MEKEMIEVIQGLKPFKRLSTQCVDNLILDDSGSIIEF